MMRLYPRWTRWWVAVLTAGLLWQAVATVAS